MRFQAFVESEIFKMALYSLCDMRGTKLQKTIAELDVIHQVIFDARENKLNCVT